MENYEVACVMGMENEIFFRYISEEELQIKLKKYKKAWLELAERQEEAYASELEADECTELYRERLAFDREWDESPAYHPNTDEDVEDSDYFYSRNITYINIEDIA